MDHDDPAVEELRRRRIVAEAIFSSEMEGLPVICSTGAMP
jgi:hypothetical protein